MVDFGSIYLWAIPIYVSECEIKQSEIQYAKDINFLLMQHGTANISKDKNVLDNKNLVSLRQNILKHVNQYAFEQLKMSKEKHKDGFYLLNSWVNRFDNNQFAPTHTHVNSIFSGVVYIDCPEDSGGGDLVFSKPENVSTVTPSNLMFDYEESNEITCNHWHIPAITKRIILFPSTQQHEVSQYIGENPRYSLAFNIFYKGKLGSDEKELIL